MRVVFCARSCHGVVNLHTVVEPRTFASGVEVVYCSSLLYGGLYMDLFGAGGF